MNSENGNYIPDNSAKNLGSKKYYSSATEIYINSFIIFFHITR